jgi:hypothetical protein
LIGKEFEKEKKKKENLPSYLFIPAAHLLSPAAARLLLLFPFSRGR